MEIVIEYALVDNLVINFLILYLSSLILKSKKNNWLFFISATLGAIVSLIIPLLVLPNWIFLVYKLLLGWVMVRIALRPMGIKANLIYFLVFLFITALMGGVCFAVIFLLSGEISASSVFLYNLEIPVGAVLLVVSLVGLTIAKLFKAFYRKKMFGNFIFDAEVLNDKKNIEFQVYLDSGNTLIDPLTNKSVVIIEYSIFKKIYDISFEKVITKKITQDDIKNSRYINYGTIGGKSKMLVFEVDCFKIKTKDKDIVIDNQIFGLSLTKLKNCFDCEALIGPDIAKDFM